MDCFSKKNYWPTIFSLQNVWLRQALVWTSSRCLLGKCLSGVCQHFDSTLHCVSRTSSLWHNWHINGNSGEDRSVQKHNDDLISFHDLDRVPPHMKSEAGKRTPKKVVCSSDLVILLPLFGHSESPESTGFLGPRGPLRVPMSVHPPVHPPAEFLF